VALAGSVGLHDLISVLRCVNAVAGHSRPEGSTKLIHERDYVAAR
jgi:hypothetical protein